jgi:hypothetical protein
MEILHVTDKPTRRGVNESAQSFPARIREQLATLHRWVLTQRVDNKGEALPLTATDIKLLEGLVISLEGQSRDRVRLSQLLEASTNPARDTVVDTDGRVLSGAQVRSQQEQLPNIHARLVKITTALSDAVEKRDHAAFQILREQAATYLADSLYMHTYPSSSYTQWAGDFPGDKLTTGLKRWAPGRLDTVLALSPANYTRDGGFWAVRKTADQIQAPLALLFDDKKRLEAVARHHPLLDPVTGYTPEQLRMLLDKARAISASYRK